ncbi:MAG TPA: hypothetical protein VJG85_00565 [Patescibacteria group bacterium]|nr:hypothetical protein [Patescibacteria group bacterium]
MTYRLYKAATFFVLLLSVSVLPLFRVYAANIQWDTVCANLDIEGEASVGPTITHLSPVQILCPLVRIGNVALLAAGVIFIIMVIYGGIKLSLSFGEPKAFAAAKATWTWAFVGFGLIIGVFALMFITTNLFSLDYTGKFDIVRPFDGVATALAQFMCAIGISDNIVTPAVCP